MLQIKKTVKNYDCMRAKSKCAEIHYQPATTTNFYIFCILCGMTTIDYSDFQIHFQIKHFDNLTNLSITNSSNIEQNDIKSDYDRSAIDEDEQVLVTSKYHDPLEFKTEDGGRKTREFNESNDDNDELKIERTNQSEATTTAFIFELRMQSEYLETQEIISVNEVNQNKLSDTLDLEQTQLQSTDDDNAGLNDGDKTAFYYKGTNIKKPASVKQTHNSKYGISIDDVDWSQPYASNLLKNNEKRPYKPRNKPNFCTYCGRTFQRRYQLDTHLNIHTGLKPHQCEFCGRQFRAGTTLTRHLSTHEQRESYRCKYCEKLFTHRAALLSHELRHTQQRSMPCDECDKYFYTNNQLDTHKRKVHHCVDSGDLPFVCDLCTKSYRSASMLSTHKLKKHYKTAKILCEQCDKKFVDETQLRTHKLIHIDIFKQKS